MQRNVSKLAATAIGLVFALGAASALAQSPMMGPDGPGPMMGGFGGQAAVHCERVRPPMPHHDMWGGRGDMWRHSKMHHRGKAGMMLLRMAHALNLTDAQRDKISDVLHKAQMDSWKTKGEIMDARYKMRELYRADQPDPRKVGDVYSEIANYKRQILETHLRARNEIWNLLTKAQQAQVHNWKHGRWQHRMHPQPNRQTMP